jgi:DNA-binding IclR family transcriptional regulator
MTQSVVKSAARVLEVFEFFAERKAGATVNDVCTSLGYPQSSTSVLLKCLHSLGYLDYEASTRHYAPSARVRALGEWIAEATEATTAGEPVFSREAAAYA